MKALAQLAVRYANVDVGRAVAAVAALPLRIADEDQVFWCEARGSELLVAGAHGIATWSGLDAPFAEEGDDLLFRVSGPLPTLRLRRRPMVPNLFVHPGLDDFRPLDALADLRAPSRWWFRPRAIEIEMTQRCNLRCTGCAIIDEVEAGYDGFETSAILALLTESERLGMYGYTLTGGEPLAKPEAVEAIIAGAPLDLLKIQTNGKVFSRADRAEALLGRLAAAGLGTTNRFIKPSINCSLGMQTEAGTPIENVAHLTEAHRRVFGDRVNLVLNVLAWDRPAVDATLDALAAAYRRIYGRRYPFQDVLRIAHMEYSATPRLEAAGLIPIERVTVRERIEALPEGYLCLAFDRDGATPLPRILVRTDGALHPCSCFGFVGSPGNVRARDLEALLDDVNADAAFRAVAEGGLPALFRQATAARPEIAAIEVPKTATICKVCKALRQPERPLYEPS